jgi:hypothetical protein
LVPSLRLFDPDSGDILVEVQDLLIAGAVKRMRLPGEDQ